MSLYENVYQKFRFLFQGFNAHLPKCFLEKLTFFLQVLSLGNGGREMTERFNISCKKNHSHDIHRNSGSWGCINIRVLI